MCFINHNTRTTLSREIHLSHRSGYANVWTRVYNLSTLLPNSCLKYLAAIQSTSNRQISTHGQTPMYPFNSTLPLQLPYISFFLQQHSYRRAVFKLHLLPHFRPPAIPSLGHRIASESVGNGPKHGIYRARSPIQH